MLLLQLSLNKASQTKLVRKYISLLQNLRFDINVLNIIRVRLWLSFYTRGHSKFVRKLMRSDVILTKLIMKMVSDCN